MASSRNEKIYSSRASSVRTRSYDSPFIFTRSDTLLAPREFDLKTAFQECLQRLNTDYLDCYLIHWPGKGGLQPSDSQHKAHREECWREMELLFDAGKIRSIGVSNYTVGHLQEMETYASIQPHVLQVEFHPCLYQRELLSYSWDHGIHVQAYSSLGEGYLLKEEYDQKDAEHISEPVLSTLKDCCTKTGLSRSHLLMKWALQHGVSIIPKSSHIERIRDNLQVVQHLQPPLDPEIMLAMDKLSSVFPHRYCWDPTFVS